MLLLILTMLPLRNAWAQLDPSTGLFRSRGRSSSTPNLDSSRYKIRQPESRKIEDDELEEKPGTLIPSPVPAKPTKPKVQVEVKNENKNVNVNTPAPPSSAVPADPGTPPELPVENEVPPPVTVQVKELILGGSDQDIDEYRIKIHPEDPRANLLSIAIAPAYYYNGSDSQYSFRRYHSNGPGLGLGMNFWMTPFFGLQSKFFTSVSGTQRSGGTNMIPTEIQTLSIGVRFRRHFGHTRKAAQLSWGIDYHDAINKISTEAQTAVGRKSSGLSFVLEGEVPTSVTYSHLFELDIRPRMKHSETQTGVTARSGTKNETNGLSLSIGGQWTLDRRNQVFWKSQYSVERNLFDGEATVADPHTSLTPDGVSVTNSLIILYFGFKWGS